jgi:hypothetical protein
MDKKKVKIKIVCPWWGRVEVVVLHCRSIKKFINESPYSVSYLAIVSPEDADFKELRDMAFGFDFDVCAYKNTPVSEKLNAGISLAMEENPDYIMNMGSDDLVDGSIWKVYNPFIKKKNPFFGIDSCHIVDHYSKKAYYLDLYNDTYPVGVLRMIHRDAINQLWDNWNLKVYPADIDRGMDTASMKRLKRYGVKASVIHSNGRVFTVGVKCNTSINHFLHLEISDKAKPVEYDSLKHLFV